MRHPKSHSFWATEPGFAPRQLGSPCQALTLSLSLSLSLPPWFLVGSCIAPPSGGEPQPQAHARPDPWGDRNRSPGTSPGHPDDLAEPAVGR